MTLVSIAIRAFGPAFFQWRPGAIPRLKPLDLLQGAPGIPMRCRAAGGRW